MKVIVAVIITFFITSACFIGYWTYDKIIHLESKRATQDLQILALKQKFTTSLATAEPTFLGKASKVQSIDWQPIVDAVPYVVGSIFIIGGVWYVSSNVSLNLAFLKKLYGFSLINFFFPGSQTEKVFTDTVGNTFKILCSDGKVKSVFSKMLGEESFTQFQVSEKVIERMSECTLDTAMMAEIISKANW